MAERGMWAGVRAGVTGRCMGVLAVAGLLVAGAARADLTAVDPEGTKRVPATIEVDWGPFAERVSLPHVVKPGDTLRGIARERCGDAERWREIAEANPGEVVEPDVIQVGATLWIPPKNLRVGEKDQSETRHDALAHRYEAYWLNYDRQHRSSIGERASPGVLPDSRKSGGSLLFARKLTNAPLERDQSGLAAISAKSLTVSMYPDTLLAAEDPAVRIVVRYELTGRDTRSVTMKTTRVRYDADDEPVTKEFEVRTTNGWPRPPRTELPPPNKDDDGAIRWAEDLPPPDDAPHRWSPLVGVMVASLGLMIVAGAAYARRRAARSES